MLRHILRDDDLTASEQAHILDLAAVMKRNRHAFSSLAGPRSVAVLFDKPSTRTRASFSVGITELGGNPLVLDAGTTQLSRGETVADTVRAIGSMVSAIVWRTYGQHILDEAAQHSPVPVVNALTNEFHPCQVLADLLTLRENFGELAGRTVAFCGDTASNMAHSTALGAALSGMNVRLVGPAECAPDVSVLARANAIAATSGATVSHTTDPGAAHDVDALITDTWLSMNHDEDLAEKRRDLLQPYQVNAKLLAASPAQSVVLHCLPAHRGDEITAEVFGSPQSLVWRQAENRLHVQKAVLAWLIGQQGTP